VAAAPPLPLLGVVVVVLGAALGVADAAGLVVADEDVEDDELAAGLGVAVAVGVLAVESVEFVVVVTFETARALCVALCASRPTVVAPTAATAVSPTVATATRRRPRSLAFTLPPTSRSSGTVVPSVSPSLESLPVRGLWLSRELLQCRGHR
jgi:hypothetical protein